MHARIVKGAAELLTRNGLNWTTKYPHDRDRDRLGEMSPGLSRRRAVRRAPGRHDVIRRLARARGRARGTVYFAFDLLHLEGEHLMRLPLLERKARARNPVARCAGRDPFQRPRRRQRRARVRGRGKLGVEGMVSKQVNKPYLPGNRGVWVKTKFLNRQEFVIVGWTDPEGSRSSLARCCSATTGMTAN